MWSAAPVAAARAGAAVRVALLRCEDVERSSVSLESSLTALELARAGEIRHDRRRTEWVAGRLAAKWLLVKHARWAAYAGHALGTSFAWPPPVRLLGSSDLCMFTPRCYRQIEIGRDGDGAPRVVRDGAGAVPARVSIAHSGGWAAAALNTGGEVGIDIEAVETRQPSFYDAYVSERERRWMRGAPEGETERLGTLLWVLKEACLKTGISPARTVLEMDAIDLEIATPAAALVGTWPAVAADGSPFLVPLSIRATLGRAGVQIHAAYGVVGPMLLGVVALTTQRSVGAPRAEAPGYPSISSVTSELLSRGGFS